MMKLCAVDNKMKSFIFWVILLNGSSSYRSKEKSIVIKGYPELYTKTLNTTIPL